MKKVTVALSLIGLVAVSAEAQPMKHEMRKAEAKERFLALDVNNNGEVSHDELMQQAASRFAEFDQDGNGILLLEELPLKMPVPPHAEQRMERMKARMGANNIPDAGGRSLEERFHDRQPTRMKFMARMDRDGNEQLTVEEFAAPMIKRYKRADINGDGTVTQAELEEMLERGPRERRALAKRMLRGR